MGDDVTKTDHPETMLYKCPGPHVWEGMRYEYTVVPTSEVEGRLSEGWHLTVPEAVEAASKSTTAQIEANEAEQAAIEKKLEAAPKLKAVHKGRGVWDVVNEAGESVKTGLSKAEAAEAAAG